MLKLVFLSIPQSQDALAFFLLAIRSRSLADTLGPFLEIPSHFGTGKLCNWVTLVNGFYNLRILVWYPPEDLLLENFLDLGVCEHIALVMTVQDDPNFIARDILACEVFQLANDIANRRYFCDRNQVELIAIPNNCQI